MKRDRLRVRRAARSSDHGLDAAMRAVCAKLGVERATPHDLRRTHGSTITALGFGRDAMNRIQNHKEGGIASVYDRHGYAEENKRVMEAVAAKIMSLVEGWADRQGSADEAGVIMRSLTLHPPAHEADIAAKLEAMRRAYEADHRR